MPLFYSDTAPTVLFFSALVVLFIYPEPQYVDRALIYSACIYMQAAVFPTLSEQEKEYYIQLEENAVFNQVFLCLDRIILLRCPLYVPPDGPEEERLVTELTNWLVRFVRAVEVDMQLKNKIANKIADMAHESIRLHLEYLRQLRKELDVLPQTDMVSACKAQKVLVLLVRIFVIC